MFTSGMAVGLENKIIQYADDATLVGVVNSPPVRDEATPSGPSFSRDMEWTDEWCSRWAMWLNSGKTKNY